MKMNAKKLTLALIALLLAVTCLFVACKKTPDPEPVDNKQEDTNKEETPVETLSKEDLEKIAAQFKKDFNDNYLSLYTDDVATDLEAMKTEAVLKITGATSLKEAQDLADAYIAKLKAARTIIDEVKDLIAKIAKDGNDTNEADPAKGVALADADDVALLSVYNARVEAAFVTAAGAQKTVLDAYKANTLQTVKDIEARLRTIQVALLAADAEGGLNDQIAAVLAKAEAATAYELDGDYELDEGKLTLKDYEDLLVLQAQVEAFAELHELAEGTEAYAEILDKGDLDAADALFAEKTANHRQIKRARDVIEAAKALAAAAKVAARVDGEVASTELKIADIQGFDSQATATVYFISVEKFSAAVEAYIDALENEQENGTVFPPEDVVRPVKVIGLWDEMGPVNDQIAVWVAKADLYADLTTAWTELNTLQIMEVAVTGDTGALNPFRVSIPVEGAYYVLDADLQAKAQAAYDAAALWNELISEAGNEDLEESIANRFYNEIIGEILAQYNESMANALEGYAEFADLLVKLNYVDEYPVKAPDFEEYVLTTDTQTIPADSDKSQRWKATLLDEIATLKQTARTPYGNGTAYVRDLFATFAPEYDTIADYIIGDDQEYTVSVHDNGNGTYTPSIFFETFAFKWLVDNTAKTEKVQVNADNTDVIDTVIDNVTEYFFKGGSEEYDANINFYELAVAMKAWVEKYIETIPADVFDLEPFMTVGAQPDAFGAVKVTFADEKLEEVAIPQITELNGEEVGATPSEALDITVYADYTVALKAIEVYDELVAELNATADALKESARNLFKPGAADYIRDASKAYMDAMRKYANCVVDSDNEPLNDEDNSLEERLAVIDEYNFENYSELFEQAGLYQNRALGLYPHDAWDEALGELKAAVESAQEDVDFMTAALEKYELAYDAAVAYLNWCKVGYSIGWTTPRTTEKEVIVSVQDGNTTTTTKEIVTETVIEEVRLVSEEDLAEAQLTVDLLDAWRNILVDATRFVIENDARRVAMTTPNVPVDPATIAVADTIQEALQPEAATTFEILQGIILIEDDEETQEDEKYTLADYMIEVLVDAYTTVEYEIVDGVEVIIARAELDKEALDAALVAATEEYEAAKAAFVASFVLVGKDSYDDLEEIEDLIADMKEFVHTAIIVGYDPETGAPIYAEYDYLNIAVTNAYTENAVDLFSQIFNEAIMGSYYRSIILVDDFTEEDVEDWVEYAINTLNTYVKSTETFATIADGEDALEDAWRFNDANYEWAVNMIYGEEGSEAHEEHYNDLMDYLQDPSH